MQAVRRKCHGVWQCKRCGASRRCLAMQTVRRKSPGVGQCKRCGASRPVFGLHGSIPSETSNELATTTLWGLGDRRFVPMSPGRYRHRVACATPLQLPSPGCLRNSAKVVTGSIARTASGPMQAVRRKSPGVRITWLNPVRNIERISEDDVVEIGV